jgi:hypothetical protein
MVGADQYNVWHIQDDWIQSDGLTVWHKVRYGDAWQLVSYERKIEPIENGSYISSDRALSLTRDDAQQLMNELWRHGLRPRDGAGSLAHVEATRAHLDDMRRLVFKDPV